MGFVDVDTLYEERDNGKVEVKNDYMSVDETAMVEIDMKKSRFIGIAFSC